MSQCQNLNKLGICLLGSVTYKQSRLWAQWFQTMCPYIKVERKYHNHKLQTNQTATQQSRDTRKTNKAKQSTLFIIKIIAKPECSQSNAQQNIEQLQNPTLGVTLNNESTTTVKATVGVGGLNAFYWYQIFALDSAVVEAARMENSIPYYHNLLS